MRRLACAAALLPITACGGEQTSDDRIPSTTETREPTPSTRNIITEGIHDKRVGQPGGFGCAEGPNAVCDVTFTVTAIEHLRHGANAVALGSRDRRRCNASEPSDR